VLIVLSCCAVGLDNTIHTPITVLHSLQELEFMLHNLHSDKKAAAVGRIIDSQHSAAVNASNVTVACYRTYVLQNVTTTVLALQPQHT